MVRIMLQEKYCKYYFGTINKTFELEHPLQLALLFVVYSNILLSYVYD